MAGYGNSYSATSPETRERLAGLGFVRVDGLKTVSSFEWGEYVIEAQPDHLGRWDYNNGRFVIITIGGEVWLAAGRNSPELYRRVEVFCQSLAPYGKGAFVPCSNGENLQAYDVLERLADPDWTPLIISSGE